MPHEIAVDDEARSAEEETPVRSCLPNEFPYKYGVVFKANWYNKFLHPSVCVKTLRLSSCNRWSEFRSYFCLTLEKVEELTNLFIDREWCTPSRRDLDDEVFYMRTQLRILGALNVLGNHTPFRQLTINTKLSTEDHRLFFHKFIEKLSCVKDDFIRYPDNFDDLKSVMENTRQKSFQDAGGLLMLCT